MATRVPTVIGDVELDASVLETYTTTAQVTEHPVEDGPDVSDHYRLEPESLSIEAWITNAPLRAPATQAEGATDQEGSQDVELLSSEQATLKLNTWGGASFDRVRAAYAELRGYMQSGALVPVETSLRAYLDMGITSLSPMRDASTGDALTFTIELKQLRKVGAQTAVVPATRLALPKRNAGRQQATAASPKQVDKSNRSLLRQIIVSASE